MPTYKVSLQGVWNFIKPTDAKKYSLPAGTNITLTPEPNNPHDVNAVIALRKDTRKKLGYIPREQAKILSPILRNGTSYTAKVDDYTFVSKGKHGPQPHVNISIEIDADIQQKLVPAINSNQFKGVSGVYAITNAKNKKVYVGSSRDIANRWQTHKRQLTTNTHSNFELQRDWNQHGEGVFRFEVLERQTNNLSASEANWIRKLDAYTNGYNQTAHGQAGTGSAAYRNTSTSRDIKPLANSSDLKSTNHQDPNETKLKEGSSDESLLVKIGLGIVFVIIMASIF